MMQTAIFVLFSLITLGAGLAVVTNNNIFHSALYLILSFVGVAGLYILLEAPFMAAVQIMVYVGAIAVLIVFAIMLTRRLMDEDVVQRNEQWVLSALGAVLLFAGLAFILFQANWPVLAGAVPGDTISDLGRDFMGVHLIPFEVTSILLLAALVGSILIAREDK